MKNRCENCKFWLTFSESASEKTNTNSNDDNVRKTGFCKRYPPVKYFHDGMVWKFSQSVPETLCDDWCGEFAEKT